MPGGTVVCPNLKEKRDFSIIWWSWDDDDKYFRPRSSFCCHFLKLNVTFKNFWILIFFHNRFETTKNFDTVHIVTINWNSDGSAMTLSQEKKQNERRSHHFKMFRRHSKSMQDYSHMQMTFAFKMNISARSILFKGSSRWLLSVKSIITTLKIFRLKVLSCFFSLCNSLLQALQRLRNGLGPQCKTAC